MTLSQRIHAQVAAAALLVTGLGAAAWYLRPERSRVWIAGIGTMAAIWLVVLVSERFARSSLRSESQRRFIALAAVIAGLILASSLGLALLKALGIADGAWQQRGQGVVVGLLFAALGNALPKILGPLYSGRCTPAGAQALQRFAGWTFVLAGLAIAGAWIFADVSQARRLATWLCAAALILVAARCVFSLSASAAPRPD
jgi:small-conductance mechanosensitive channel